MLALSWAQGKRQCWAPTKGLGKKFSNCHKPAPPLLRMFLRICVHARGGLGEGTQQAFQKAGEPHACRKGGCGGGWGIPAMSPLASGKCLQRNMKPGQGSCCPSFFVVPPYANLVSASWHGQLAWLNNPSWIATWSGLWLEVEVERAAPSPHSPGPTPSPGRWEAWICWPHRARPQLFVWPLSTRSGTPSGSFGGACGAAALVAGRPWPGGQHPA